MEMYQELTQTFLYPGQWTLMSGPVLCINFPVYYCSCPLDPDPCPTGSYSLMGEIENKPLFKKL